MRDDQPRQNSENKSCDKERPLLIEDLVRYISRLVALSKDSRTGNVELSHALLELANVLRPHSRRSIRELSDIFGVDVAGTRKPGPKDAKATLPPDLPTLSEQQIETILEDHTYTKLQLIEVGIQRFGISRSRLIRLTKDEVCESVRAALKHEKSLGVIAQEARRGGDERSS